MFMRVRWDDRRQRVTIGPRRVRLNVIMLRILVEDFDEGFGGRRDELTI